MLTDEAEVMKEYGYGIEKKLIDERGDSEFMQAQYAEPDDDF